MKTLNDFHIHTCKNCGGSNLVWDSFSGEIVCENCGIVVTDLDLYYGPEKRAFTIYEAEIKSRTGMPLSFSVFDKGLPTMIDRLNKDAYGRQLPINTLIKMRRLKKLQSESRFHKNNMQNLSKAMAHIDLLSERLHIPNTVKEQAAIYYRKAFKKRLIRGRSIHAMADACFYAACRMNKIPRTLDEVARLSPMDVHDISKSYRLLLEKLDLKTPVPKAQIRVPKIACQLGIDMETEKKAVEILKEAERLKITSGKDPMGLAAAALYIACSMNNRGVTQKELSHAAGITEVTIRNRRKNLIRNLHLKLKNF